jgi:hypothetical protein
MIGALTVTGRRAAFLWALSGIFVIIAIGYAGVFSGIGLAVPALNQWIFALVAPVVIITVAMMLREKASKPPESDPQDQTVALREISTAISNADWQDYDVPADSAKAGQAVLESAFATVRKRYKIPTPVLGQPSTHSLKHGVAFLRCIQPYLRAGHIEEAREAAEAFQYP